MAFPHDARQKAFLTAASNGDVDAVKAYFEEPDVRANVVVWEALCHAKRTNTEDPSSRTSPPHPWYDDLFGSSIARSGGRVNLFRWFFADQQLVVFGETLRAIVADIWEACLVDPHRLTATHEIVEIVGESRLFKHIMDDDERSRVLCKTLHTAVSCGKAHWVDVLLAYGADPNLEWEHETPLAALAQGGTVETLDVLLAHGAWVLGEGVLPPRAQASHVSKRLVGAMLRYGADANAVVPNRSSALYNAASASAHDIIEILIQDGFADIDARDRDGCTPLMMVAGDGANSPRWGMQKYALVAVLLHAGADPNAADHTQRSVLHHVVRGLSLACLESLLERGVNPNCQDRSGHTPLATLMEKVRGDVTEAVANMLTTLLRVGADPFTRDRDGQSAVHRLEGSESGRAFMKANRSFFRHQVD